RIPRHQAQSERLGHGLCRYSPGRTLLSDVGAHGRRARSRVCDRHPASRCGADQRPLVRPDPHPHQPRDIHADDSVLQAGAPLEPWFGLSVWTWESAMSFNIYLEVVRDPKSILVPRGPFDDEQHQVLTKSKRGPGIADLMLFDRTSVAEAADDNGTYRVL